MTEASRTVALVDYDEDLFEVPGWMAGDLAAAGVKLEVAQCRTTEAAAEMARRADVVMIQSVRPLMTRDAIERRLAQHIETAQDACGSLRSKRVTMHTMRHTAAMNLLAAGVDTSTIALWLGHEQISTTSIYLHADMTHKQEAIDRTKPLATKPGRYRAPDTLLAFLDAL